MLSPSTRNYAGTSLSRVHEIPEILFLRLNVHLSSIVASKPFQMPVEVVARVTKSFEDADVSRLNSFGFSGTMAHGVFGARKVATVLCSTGT